MKKIIWLSLVVILGMSACSKDSGDVNEEKQLPEKFKVDIPKSMSKKSTEKNIASDTLSGAELYEHMRLFISLGETGAQMVQDIMNSIRLYNLSQQTSFSYISDDDQRSKDVVVIESAMYENATWDFGLTISDAGNKAMQVFWNIAPVRGVAILNVSEINHNDVSQPDLLVKLEYSEAEADYDAQMIVSVASFTVNPLDEFGMDNVQMFVGKKGDLVEVIGTSNHPNLDFDLPATSFEKGRAWSFTARGYASHDAAVAMLAIPPSSLDNTAEMMDTYSVYNVLRDIILIQYPALSAYPQLLEGYLVNAHSPAYFTEKSFLGSGANLPADPLFTQEFVNLSGLTPYIPKNVRDLNLIFAN